MVININKYKGLFPYWDVKSTNLFCTHNAYLIYIYITPPKKIVYISNLNIKNKQEKSSVVVKNILHNIIKIVDMHKIKNSVM